MAQYSVWLNEEPLIVVHFTRREGKGKNKKNVCELVAEYGLLTMKNELLVWFHDQHARMRYVF